MRVLVEPAKVGVLIFVAAILQVTLFSSAQILGGTPDVVLLTLVAIALLRGSVYGASAGFAAGLLVDTANLGTLGRHVAPADDRRLLDRPLRRDDRARPRARAVRVGRGGHGARPVRRALPALHARRSRLGAGGAARRAAGEGAAEPDPDAAGLRARAPCALASRPRPRARRRCSCLASTGARAGRSGSNRFLPPDPRVEEPYRFTPQLALRLGILGAVALIAVRDPLLPALGAPGALGPAVPARGAGQPGALDPRPGRARRHPRPQRPPARRQRRRHRRAALAGRPAEEVAGPARRAAAALAGAEGAGAADPRRDQGARQRPGHAGDRARVGQARRRRSTTSTSTRRSSRACGIVPTFLRSYNYGPLASQLLGYVSEISPAQVKRAAQGGLPAGRHDRPGRARGDVRPLPPRPGGARAADGRLARPAAQRPRAGAAAEARRVDPPDARHQPAARGRERDPLRDRPRLRAQAVAGQRRLDRRARPARRLDPRAWRPTRPTTRASTPAA